MFFFLLCLLTPRKASIHFDNLVHRRENYYHDLSDDNDDDVNCGCDVDGGDHDFGGCQKLAMM